MFHVLTLNKISQTGLAHFNADAFACASDFENPDAIIVRSAAMHEMEFAGNLLAIARAGAGVNNIPIDRCTEAGICVFNTPGANANAVKELVICSLFLASRKIYAGAKWCEELKGSGDEVSKKVEKGKSNFAGIEISGKTLGVIGLGAIGLLVANTAVSLGMKVVGYDPFLSAEGAKKLNPAVSVVDTTDAVFAASDYITLHVPLNDATRSLICEQSFAKCKKGVRILNFARGELVNSADMINALQSGTCGGYVTDFPTDEQLGVDGVTAIPHLGASTEEAEENCAVMAVNQLADYLQNGNIVNSVNLPAVSLPKTGNIRLTAVTKGDLFEALTKTLQDNGAKLINSATGVKKGNGYCIFDTENEIDDALLKTLEEIEGVLSIRII